MTEIKRIVCWFSCGAASAIATKLAISENAGKIPLIIAYTEIEEEHKDNKRFTSDCEKWFGQEIVILGSEKYKRSTYEVYEKTRYLVGPDGAACTRLLKKKVRIEFQHINDMHIFGYTAEEEDRLNKFIDANNEVMVKAPLIDSGLTKSDCLAMLERAGIELPEMYKLGYHNNNCIGCVKGGAGYWNKIRVDFPTQFERMAKTEEMLGRTICKITVDGQEKRVSLRELPLGAGHYPSEPNIECGIFCEMAENDIKGNV